MAHNTTFRDPHGGGAKPQNVSSKRSGSHSAGNPLPAPARAAGLEAPKIALDPQGYVFAGDEVDRFWTEKFANRCMRCGEIGHRLFSDNDEASCTNDCMWHRHEGPYQAHRSYQHPGARCELVDPQFWWKYGCGLQLKQGLNTRLRVSWPERNGIPSDKTEPLLEELRDWLRRNYVERLTRRDIRRGFDSCLEEMGLNDGEIYRRIMREQEHSEEKKAFQAQVQQMERENHQLREALVGRALVGGDYSLHDPIGFLPQAPRRDPEPFQDSPGTNALSSALRMSIDAAAKGLAHASNSSLTGVRHRADTADNDDDRRVRPCVKQEPHEYEPVVTWKKTVRGTRGGKNVKKRGTPGKLQHNAECKIKPTETGASPAGTESLRSTSCSTLDRQGSTFTSRG